MALFSRRKSPDAAWVRAAKSILQGLVDPAALLDSELELIDCNRPYASICGERRQALQQALGGEGEVFEVLSEEPGLELELARECIRLGRGRNSPWVKVHNKHGDCYQVIRMFLPIIVESGASPVGILLVYRDVTDEAAMHDHYRTLLASEKARSEALEQEVSDRTAELRTALEEVTRLSRTDPLTGVLNRRAFAEHARQAMALAKRHHRHCGLLMCDLDFFKSVNDNYGHSAGDTLLVAVAGALARLLRGADVVARFGGEEFVVMLTETNPNSVAIVCERIRKMVAELPMADLIPEKKTPQTVSIGAAMFPRDGYDLDSLIENADKALYSAKLEGRDRYVVYSSELAGLEEHKKSGPDRAGSARVLLVDSDRARLEKYRDALAAQYYVVVATSAAHGLSLCSRERYDVIVADEDMGQERGIAFLYESLSLRPSAMRVLLIRSEDDYLSLRGTNRGRVDHFLLRQEALMHLSAAIRDGLARRELALQELLSSSNFGRAGAEADERAVQEVISSNSIQMAYQPMVDAKTHAVLACEALCRPTSGRFKDPEALFVAAVHTGLIWRLGDLVRDKIAEDMTKIDVPVFVNLHPAEIANPMLLEAPGFSSDQSSQVVFEITERSSITNPQEFRNRLQELRELGFRFAIDDLGAGYASLNSVALVGPEYIKVDMALIRDIHLSEQKRSLVESLVGFANSAEIIIIAEGVENELEANVATEIGCHLLQGYYFGKPKPLS